MIAPVSMSVPGHAGLRCELKRNDRGEWLICLWKTVRTTAGFRRSVMVVFVCGHGHVPKFKSSTNCFELVLESTYIELPEAGWKKLKAWFDQVTNAREGDNRGVPAGGSHAGPAAAAGQPGAAVQGELQPTPPDEDAQPGLRQVGGRQAPPAQLATPAGGL